MDRGMYTLNNLVPIRAGSLAISNPHDASPFVPALTNLQFALNVASSAPFAPVLPYHNFSVARNAGGIPMEGAYTRSDLIVALLANLAPWRSRATMIDYFGIPCGAIDRPYDDHLNEIRVPVLYIAAAGGF